MCQDAIERRSHGGFPPTDPSSMVHQSGFSINRIRNPRRKNSSISGTNTAKSDKPNGQKATINDRSRPERP